jgi:hypothetical protein
LRSSNGYAVYVRVAVENDDAVTIGDRGTDPGDWLGGVHLEHLDLSGDLVTRSYRRHEAPSYP